MPNDQSWNVAVARVAANITLGAAYIALATPVITATATSSSSSSIALTVPSPNSVSYQLERSTDGVNWSVLQSQVFPGEFPYPDTPLDPETTYYYRAFASDATDDSDYSAVTNATTEAAPAPADYTAKTDPTRQFTVDINAIGGADGVQGASAGGRLNGKDTYSSSDSAFYDTAVTYKGDPTMRSDLLTGQTGAASMGGYIDFRTHGSAGTELRKGDEFWARTAIYYPPGWIAAAGRQKFLRFKVAPYSGDVKQSPDRGYIDLYTNIEMIYGTNKYPYFFIYEGTQVWSNLAQDQSQYQVTRGQWIEIEWHVVLDNVSKDLGGEAEVKVWVNQDLIATITDQQTLNAATDRMWAAYLFGYYDNGGAPQDQSVWNHSFKIMSSVPSNRDAAGNPYMGAI